MKEIKSGSFSEACFNQNSISDLQEFLLFPDKTDMEIWGLSEDEYKKQIRIALDNLKK